MKHRKIQNSLFLFMMAGLMVIGMNSYHFLLQGNFSFPLFFKKYIILLFVALLSISIVSKIVSKITSVISSNQIFNTIYLVIGMVTCMSILGTIMSNGLTINFFFEYFKTWGTNFIVALPLQLLIVGPIVRNIFQRLSVNDIE